MDYIYNVQENSAIIVKNAFLALKENTCKNNTKNPLLLERKPTCIKKIQNEKRDPVNVTVILKVILPKAHYKRTTHALVNKYFSRTCV